MWRTRTWSPALTSDITLSPLKLGSCLRTYINDSNMYVALLDHRDSQTYRLNGQGNLETLLHKSLHSFPKKVVDRYCLLVPSQVPQAETYPGPLSVSSLVQFLNERCGAFRTLSGGVSPAGALHEHIMSNLYHIPAHGSTTTCLRLKTLPTKKNSSGITSLDHSLLCLKEQ